MDELEFNLSRSQKVKSNGAIGHIDAFLLVYNREFADLSPF